MFREKTAHPHARTHLEKARRLRESDSAAAVTAARRAWAYGPCDVTLADEVAELLAGLGEAGLASQLAAESRALAATHISTFPVWSEPPREAAPLAAARALYLDLMEKTVCNWIYADAALRSATETAPFDPDRRNLGRDIPAFGHTMIGLRRLRHLRWAAETAIAEGVPGDFMECGVWRGGAVALLRAVLAAHGEGTRRVWAADSFAGLPPPDPRFAKDGDTVFDFHKRPELAVGVETVRNNIARYGLLDERIVFLKGLFHDTLAAVPGLGLAILRIDGDLYSSTMDVLRLMYDNVAPGGIVILDDYGAVVDSHRAVEDFRKERGIAAPMIAVDGDAAYWRKPA